MDYAILITLLSGLVLSATICIMIRNLIKAAITMAVTSGILAIIMFLLDAPLAAVFELSVCAGLITVIFISAISMSHVHSKQENMQMEKARRKRFILLPILLVALLCSMVLFFGPHTHALLPHATITPGETAQSVLWNSRQVELLGLIIIILTGVSGVIVFFKEGDSN